MRDENYILLLVRLVEEKTGWGNSDEWTNYNFSLLSDGIEKITAKRISDSTLKRIFGKKKTKRDFYNPHIYTKNILVQYLGYTNWDDFKKQHSKEAEDTKIIKKKSHPGRKGRRLNYSMLIFLTFGVIIILFFVISNNIFSKNPLVQFDVKESVGKVPFTAVFKYELNNTNDSIHINFGNNEVYFLSPRREMITQFYPGVDYTTVRVSRRDKTIASEKIHLISGEWQSGYSPNDSVYAYRPFEDQEIMYSRDRLFIPVQKLKDLLPPDERNCFIEYRYFDKFHVSLDNLELLSCVKNSPDEGGIRCYDVEIILKGENSDLVVRFLEPGCFRYARFNVGEKKYFGRFHDLSEFARDVSDWCNIKLKVSNGVVSVFFENDLIRKESYTENMGELKGIIYRFYGTGSVDYVRLESEGSLLLENDF